MALFALGCIVGFAFLEPQWYRSWLGGLAALVGLAAANSAVLNVLVRRQNTFVIVTEIPLVLAIYFLPASMVIIAVTLGALVARARARMEPTKLWFNVAKSAASCAAALLVVAALPDIHGAGPSTWGVLFAAGITNAVVSHVAVVGVVVACRAGTPALSRCAPDRQLSPPPPSTSPWDWSS